MVEEELELVDDEDDVVLSVEGGEVVEPVVAVPTSFAVVGGAVPTEVDVVDLPVDEEEEPQLHAPPRSARPARAPIMNLYVSVI